MAVLRGVCVGLCVVGACLCYCFVGEAVHGCVPVFVCLVGVSCVLCFHVVRLCLFALAIFVLCVLLRVCICACAFVYFRASCFFLRLFVLCLYLSVGACVFFDWFACGRVCA